VVITNIDKFRSYWQNRNPLLYGDKSNKEIFDLVRERHPELKVPTYEQSLLTQIPEPYKEEVKKEESLNDVDTDPSTIKSWFLTGDFVPEEFTKKGFAGISPQWFRDQYNKSMPGQIYKAIHGQDKYGNYDEEGTFYDMDNYDPNWAAQAGQFALGMLSPLSIATIVGTGALGRAATVVGSGTLFGGTRFIQRGILSTFGNNYPKMATGIKMFTEGSISMGVGGGAFSAAHAATMSAAEQRMSEIDEDGRGVGKVNIKKVMHDASDEFLHSLPMFAAAGGITHGIMGPVYGWSKAYGDQTLIGKKIIQAATSPLARVPVEAAIFTAMPSMLGQEGAPKMGEDGFWENFGTNLVLVGSMRAVGAAFNPQSVIGGKFEAYKFFATEISLEKNLKINTKKSLESIERDLGRTLPPELRNKSLELIKDTYNLENNLKIGKKDLEFIINFNQKLKKKSFAKQIANKGSQQSKDFAKYSRLVADYSAGLIGTIEAVLGDKTRLRENYKSMFKKYPNSQEELAYTKFLENLSKNTQDKRTNVDKEWRGNIEDSPDGINEGVSHRKVDPWAPKTPQGEKKRIDLLINELSAESGRKQSSLRKDREFQEQIQGEWHISTEKLESALRPYREAKGVGDLKIKRKEVKEDIDGYYKETDYGKIGAKEKVQDYASRKLGKDNDYYHDALYGFSKYSSKRVSKSPPSYYKTLIDYFKYLKENNLEIREATSIITERYAKQNNLTKPQKKTLNDAISSFYGTGDAGGRKGLQTGFAYDFMVKEGRVPSVAVLGKGWGTPPKAGKEKIAVAEPGEYKKFSDVKKKNLKVSSKEQQIGIVNIKDGIVILGKRRKDGSLKKNQVSHKVESLDAAIDMLYEFGARGIDVLERIKVSDINWKTGEIKKFSTGAEGSTKSSGNRIDIPLREVIPELFAKLEKVKGNRSSTSNQPLFSNDKGKLLTKDFINKYINETIPKDLKFYGDKKAFTVQDFRRMIETDASGTKWSDFIDLKLVAHKGQGTRTTYIHKEFIKDWKEWRAFRDGEAQQPLISTKKTKPKGNISGTKAEQIKFWEDQVASIKRDLKNETSIGRIQDLKSELKAASFSLSAAKKLKERRVSESQRPIEERVFQTNADKAKRDAFIEKVLKKNNLSPEDLKREGLNKGVLGEFGEGVIKLQKGLWQPADFYHENLHRLKAFAKASNNKGLEKLIERGEGLAKNTKEYRAWKKKNVGRDVEEFLADVVGGKASRMDFTPSMLGKIKSFVNQLVSRVKVAFGAGNFKDISNVLAKRVQKGFSTEGVEFAKSQIKYKMEGMNQKEAANYARSVLSEVYTKGELSISQKERMIRHIGEVAGLGEKFKLNKQTPIEHIETFIATLNTMDKTALRQLPNKTEWWVNFKDSEKMRISRNVTEKQRTSMLKDLGVLDGSYYNATARQLKDFVEILGTMDKVKKVSWIDEKVAVENLNPEIAKRFSNLSFRKLGMPVGAVLESVGLKGVADKLYSHTSKELEHIGKFSKFDLGMRDKVGKRTWDKAKDYIYLFDKERYKERLDAGLLSSAEKKFVKEQIDIGSWKAKGDIAKEYMGLMKYYRDELKTILKEILNDAEYEKFMSEKNVQWLDPKNNVYVQRRLTKEFKRHYNTSGRNFEKLIQEQTDAISFKLAKKFFKEKNKENVSKTDIAKKAAELRDLANSLAHHEIYELFEFNVNKYSPSFLKKRHAKLPEFVTIDGKKVQVYETKYNLTVKDYAINQAKFLANIEYFPEFVKLKGFDRPGAKKFINQMKTTDRHLGDWVEKRIKSHLNIDKNSFDYPDGIRITRHITSTVAKLQLSFPTSGLKNFLVGQSQNLLAFRLRDFIGGFADVIHKDNRALVRATGALEIGLRHIEIGGFAGKVDNIIEKGIFKWGGMRPSENLNRYVSVLAGRRDQAHQVRRLQNSPEGTWGYNSAVRKLQGFYKLNQNEISLLKKYGLNGVKGTDKKTAAINRRAVENLYQKMNTFAHINTQGAAINLFMPDWGAGPLMQSAILFKRMAFAASANTARNMKIAGQNKSLLQPIMFGVGAYYSGEALLWVYSEILGTPPPKENSPKWKLLLTSLWKGEFLGIASEILSPFEGSWQRWAMPAVISTAETSRQSFMAVAKGDEYVSQGLGDVMRSSVGLVNGVYKLFNQGLFHKDGTLNKKSYAYKDRRFRNLSNEYLDEIDDDTLKIISTELSIEGERNKVQRAFNHLFKSGRSKDAFGNSLGKWYMMTLFTKANDFYYEEKEMGNIAFTEKDAMKKAKTSMKTIMQNLNPNQFQVWAKEKKARLKGKLKEHQWNQWLGPELKAELDKAVAEYGARYRLTMQQVDEYIKEANLSRDLEYYGITFHKK